MLTHYRPRNEPDQSARDVWRRNTLQYSGLSESPEQNAAEPAHVTQMGTMSGSRVTWVDFAQQSRSAYEPGQHPPSASDRAYLGPNDRAGNGNQQVPKARVPTPLRRRTHSQPHAAPDTSTRKQHGDAAAQAAAQCADQPDPSHCVREKSELTHVKDGPLGSVIVVADTYVGPMPPNAIGESDYRRMVRIYERIDSGESSVQFDLRNFFGKEGEPTIVPADGPAYEKATADAAKFRDQYMGYIRELVKTPAGLQLLTRLDSSRHKTTIQHSTDNVVKARNNDAGHLSRKGVPGPGTDVTVGAAPSLTEWDGEMCQHGKQPWMDNRPKFAFYHELVHAYRFNRGDNELDGHGHAQCVTAYSHELAKKEFQAVGLGPYAANAVSENTIRAQMGVPLRPTYSGMSWGGPDIWAKQKDADERSRRNPSR